MSKISKGVIIQYNYGVSKLKEITKTEINDSLIDKFKMVSDYDEIDFIYFFDFDTNYFVQLNYNKEKNIITTNPDEFLNKVSRKTNISSYRIGKNYPIITDDEVSKFKNLLEEKFGYSVNYIDKEYDLKNRIITIELNGNLISWEPNYDFVNDMVDEYGDEDYNDLVNDTDYWEPNMKELSDLKKELKLLLGDNFINLEWYEKFGLTCYIKVD